MTENRCESAACQQGEWEEALLFGSSSALNFILPGLASRASGLCLGPRPENTMEIHSSFYRLYGKCEWALEGKVRSTHSLFFTYVHQKHKRQVAEQELGWAGHSGPAIGGTLAGSVLLSTVIQLSEGC